MDREFKNKNQNLFLNETRLGLKCQTSVNFEKKNLDSKVFSPSNFIELKILSPNNHKVQKYQSKKFWVQNFCQENCGYKGFKSEKIWSKRI